MPRTWTRLHEHLGCPPGPVDFAMVRRCVDDQLAEADDLDWKETLPQDHDPKAAGEFAKDVAAMANTRGGLIIYGVTDNPVAFNGITPTEAKPDQYAQWVRNFVQPYLVGLEQHVLHSDDGTEAVLVVDVPASEQAPHSVAFDTSDRAKSQFASVTPYRDRSHTDWMAEHQIARAYADRLLRGLHWETSFNELQKWLSEVLPVRSGAKYAWLLVIGRPTRPIPRTAPRLSADEAKAVVNHACDHPVEIKNPVIVLQQLDASQQPIVRVGLNCWIITNGSFGRQVPNEVYVELHHDGSFALAVNATQRDLRSTSPRPVGSVINSDVVEQVCADLEALIPAASRAWRIDSPIRLRMSVISEPGVPVQCATRDSGGYYDVSTAAPALVRVRSVDSELHVGATEDGTRIVSAELAAGILNQFGLPCRTTRYRDAPRTAQST